MRRPPERPRGLSIDEFRVHPVTMTADMMRLEPADDETTTSIMRERGRNYFPYLWLLAPERNVEMDSLST